MSVMFPEEIATQMSDPGLDPTSHPFLSYDANVRTRRIATPAASCARKASPVVRAEMRQAAWDIDIETANDRYSLAGVEVELQYGADDRRRLLRRSSKRRILTEGDAEERLSDWWRYAVVEVDHIIHPTAVPMPIVCRGKLELNLHPLPDVLER